MSENDSLQTLEIITELEELHHMNAYLKKSLEEKNQEIRNLLDKTRQYDILAIEVEELRDKVSGYEASENFRQTNEKINEDEGNSPKHKALTGGFTLMKNIKRSSEELQSNSNNLNFINDNDDYINEINKLQEEINLKDQESDIIRRRNENLIKEIEQRFEREKKALQEEITKIKLEWDTQEYILRLKSAEAEERNAILEKKISALEEKHKLEESNNLEKMKYETEISMLNQRIASLVSLANSAEISESNKNLQKKLEKLTKELELSKSIILDKDKQLDKLKIILESCGYSQDVNKDVFEDKRNDLQKNNASQGGVNKGRSFDQRELNGKLIENMLMIDYKTKYENEKRDLLAEIAKLKDIISEYTARSHKRSTVFSTLDLKNENNNFTTLDEISEFDDESGQEENIPKIMLTSETDYTPQSDFKEKNKNLSQELVSLKCQYDKILDENLHLKSSLENERFEKECDIAGYKLRLKKLQEYVQNFELAVMKASLHKARCSLKLSK